jgi:hypothetical protein
MPSCEHGVPWSVRAAVAEALLAEIEEISKIFWETKRG